MRVEDDPAFEALFRATYAPLVRSLSVGESPEVAADAVQEAFFEAAKRWRRIRSYERPEAWVRRAAVHRLLNHKRGRRRHDAALDRVPIPPDAELHAADLDLRAAVEALPRTQRLAVALHYLADVPVREVADLLEVSEGTVKSNLFDARRALRRTLEVHDDA